MDLSKQFSFTDFLAYLFPGAFAIVGLYVLLLLSPAKQYVGNIPLDITTGLIFLVFSYIIGVILSGFSGAAVSRIEKITKYQDGHGIIPSDLFPDDVIDGFKDVMGIPKDKELKWTQGHYRVCLMMVEEKMPTITQRVERQRIISLFRRNLISPLIVWEITGISWGVSTITRGQMWWGIIIIVFSLAIFGASIKATIDRMHHGAKIEIRETISGFIAGYKLGLFSKNK